MCVRGGGGRGAGRGGLGGFEMASESKNRNLKCPREETRDLVTRPHVSGSGAAAIAANRGGRWA